MARISDILPVKTKVDTGNGFLEVGPLPLEAVSVLMVRFRQPIFTLLGATQGEKPDFGTVINEFPDLAAAVIAHAFGDPEQEDDAKRLPLSAQLIALTEIWNLTVPDAKKLSQSLSGVTAQLQSAFLKGNPGVAASPSTSSNPNSPEASAT